MNGQLSAVSGQPTANLRDRWMMAERYVKSNEKMAISLTTNDTQELTPCEPL
jgi:hypothetical protein